MIGGKIHHIKALKLIPKVKIQEKVGWFAAAVGTTTLGSADQRFVATAGPTTGATT